MKDFLKYNTLIKKIQSVLTDDLLNPAWKKIVKKEDNHFTAGHCYAASEALYHLLGGKEAGFKPQVGKSDNGTTHWWLIDEDNKILDPTATQFFYKNLIPPYNNGKGNGFLTKKPSKRAQTIIDRIKEL